MSLAAVNQIYVIHEAMNGCKKKKSKGSLKACFKNVNIHCMNLTLYLTEMAFNTFANRADPEKAALVRAARSGSAIFVDWPQSLMSFFSKTDNLSKIAIYKLYLEVEVLGLDIRDW